MREMTLIGNSPSDSAPLAIVTGSTGGFGKEFVRLLAEDGFDLLLIARDEEALRRQAQETEQSSGRRCSILVADLSEGAGVQKVVCCIQNVRQPVRVLVNNAGFGALGAFQRLEPPGQMIAVNAEALAMLTHAVLPQMVAAREGLILNVASAAAFSPGPLMATYYATKAFVLSFSEALSEELRGSGVRVCAFCPGPSTTGFGARAGIEGTPTFDRHALPPGRLVAIGYARARAGQVVIVPSLRIKAMLVLSRLVPRSMVRWWMGRQLAIRARASGVSPQS